MKKLKKYYHKGTKPPVTHVSHVAKKGDKK
jgi:hypothetical protein